MGSREEGDVGQEGLTARQNGEGQSWTGFDMAGFMADRLKLVMWEYDIPRRRIVVRNPECLRDDIPSVLERVPDSLIPYIDERSTEDIRRMYADIDAGCPHTSCKVWYKNKRTGRLSCEEVHYRVVMNECGQPVKGYGISRDLTDSFQLQQKQLEEMQEVVRLGQAAMDVKNEFLSNVSHDMRTPLNGIIGFTGLALKSQDLQKIRQYLQKIRVSGSLLLDLVNDTLMLSKLASGKLEPKYEIIDNRTISTRVVIPISAAAAKKHIDFVVDRDKSPQTLMKADRVNTQKIFLNLLSNAVKFTPEGGRVEIHMERLQQPLYGCNYRFIVRDNGIGISPEFLHQIYEPFSQETRAMTRNVQGTGLGLAIVKQLVDLLRGRIEVKSEIGKGTEFTVYLPMEIVTGQEAKAAARKSAQRMAPDVWMPAETTALEESMLEVSDGAAPETMTKDGPCLLLCEDNYLNMEIAVTVLESRGYTVVCAANGQEGVDIFAGSREGEFAAILMDLRMPVMNGYDAARAIRAMDRPDAVSIPIIAMSADAFEEDIAMSRAAGMNEHLGKPVNVGRLYEVLEKFIVKEAPFEGPSGGGR